MFRGCQVCCAASVCHCRNSHYFSPACFVVIHPPRKQQCVCVDRCDEMRSCAVDDNSYSFRAGVTRLRTCKIVHLKIDDSQRFHKNYILQRRVFYVKYEIITWCAFPSISFDSFTSGDANFRRTNKKKKNKMFR